MKPEGMRTPRPWAYILLGAYFLAFGMISFTEALSEVQDMSVDIDASMWPLILSLFLTLLFVCGWAFPTFYYEKYNFHLGTSQHKKFIVALVALIVLDIALLIALSPHRFAYRVFVSSQQILASGVSFGFASLLRQKISQTKTK